MEKVLQELPDMPPLTLIWELSSPEEMIWRPLPMSSFISLEDPYHGKVLE